MIDEDAIRRRFEALQDRLDERGRRLFAAAEVRAAGYGGLAAVARATGIARSTLGRGLKELDQPPLPAGRLRRPGSGRRPLTDLRPTAQSGENEQAVRSKLNSAYGGNRTGRTAA
jgi:hypothetical protein